MHEEQKWSAVWWGGDEISINTSTDARIDKKAEGGLFIVLLSERAKRDLTLFNSHSMFPRRLNGSLKINTNIHCNETK